MASIPPSDPRKSPRNPSTPAPGRSIPAPGVPGEDPFPDPNPAPGKAPGTPGIDPTPEYHTEQHPPPEEPASPERMIEFSTGREGHFATVQSSHLRDVEDELHDLAAILRCLPDLEVMAGVMDQIIAEHEAGEAMEPKLTRDRIGDMVRELPRRARARAALPAIDEAALIDLRSTIDAILAMLRYRVERLAAVVAVM